jgi:hypothetical protein
LFAARNKGLAAAQILILIAPHFCYDLNQVALFLVEIISLARAIYFELLQLRLIMNVHQRVQRGELTERGLARAIGISQPHLHNMLKGVRVLSPPMADLLLRHLHMTVLDLLDTDEITARRPRGGSG